MTSLRRRRWLFGYLIRFGQAQVFPDGHWQLDETPANTLCETIRSTDELDAMGMWLGGFALSLEDACTDEHGNSA
ncbi:MAG: hypothetical protein J7M26_07475 [Armatimonadetes bacterium]|nr:hypothetical protein [Armatimonadota bacterium]